MLEEQNKIKQHDSECSTNEFISLLSEQVYFASELSSYRYEIKIATIAALVAIGNAFPIEGIGSQTT